MAETSHILSGSLQIFLNFFFFPQSMYGTLIFKLGTLLNSKMSVCLCNLSDTEARSEGYLGTFTAQNPIFFSLSHHILPVPLQFSA